jgi:hypothetical protein
MQNKELLDYIKQKISEGLTDEEINKSLIANGWTSADIKESLNQETQNNEAVPQTAFSNKKTQILKITIFSILGLSLAATFIYFYNQPFFNTKQEISIDPIQDKTQEEVTPPTSITKEMVETTNPIQKTEEQLPKQSPEIAFADSLISCTKNVITFEHPFTGEMLKKEISGIINGKCIYIEQMPNNGKMECKYTENERKVVAQYYKDIINAESISTDVSVNSKSNKKEITYTINGKNVTNPLEEMMSSGVCTITGY